MKKYLKFFIIFIVSINFSFAANTKDIPSSFADLAEKEKFIETINIKKKFIYFFILLSTK